MEKMVLAFFVLFSGINVARAQTQAPAQPTLLKAASLSKINQRTLVRDSAGKRYDYTAWSSMVASGRYGIKVVTFPNEKPSLVLSKLTNEERAEVMAQSPKPEPSTYFKTGDVLRHFRENDLSGVECDTKKMTGKILVINFCDLKNSSSLRAIPDLNDLAQSYQNNADVVFMAIPVDNKGDVEDILKTMPFKFRLINRGRALSAKLNVAAYPTYLIVDQKGLVQYHSTGYTPSTYYWMGKAIDEMKLASK